MSIGIQNVLILLSPNLFNLKNIFFIITATVNKKACVKRHINLALFWIFNALTGFFF